MLGYFRVATPGRPEAGDLEDRQVELKKYSRACTTLG
jgi:hypothetical protein